MNHYSDRHDFYYWETRLRREAAYQCRQYPAFLTRRQRRAALKASRDGVRMRGRRLTVDRATFREALRIAIEQHARRAPLLKWDAGEGP